eukprot:gene16177-19254_t
MFKRIVEAFKYPPMFYARECLIASVASGNLDIVKMLYDPNVRTRDANTQVFSDTMLAHAITANSHDIVTWLIERGHRNSIKGDSDSQKHFYRCGSEGNLEMISRFFKDPSALIDLPKTKLKMYDARLAVARLASMGAFCSGNVMVARWLCENMTTFIPNSEMRDFVDINGLGNALLYGGRDMYKLVVEEQFQNSQWPKVFASTERINVRKGCPMDEQTVQWALKVCPNTRVILNLALRGAVLAGDMAMVRWLVANGLTTQDLFSIASQSHTPPSFAVFGSFRLEFATFLLQGEPDGFQFTLENIVYCSQPRDHRWMGLIERGGVARFPYLHIHWAIQHCNVEQLKDIIQLHRHVIDQIDNQALVELACADSQYAMVKYMTRECTPAFTCNPITCLKTTLDFGDVEMIKLLIEDLEWTPTISELGISMYSYTACTRYLYNRYPSEFLQHLVNSTNLARVYRLKKLSTFIFLVDLIFAKSSNDPHAIIAKLLQRELDTTQPISYPQTAIEAFINNRLYGDQQQQQPLSVSKEEEASSTGGVAPVEKKRSKKDTQTTTTTTTPMETDTAVAVESTTSTTTSTTTTAAAATTPTASNNHNNNGTKQNGGGGNSDPLKMLKGFESIGDGVIRNGKEVDFVASVDRVSKYTAGYLKKTPQYNYELLSQQLKCDVQLKLENLQLFGDLYVRNCLSVLLGNYFNQATKLNREFREIGGFVLVMDPTQRDLHVQLSGTVLTALHLKMRCIIYVAPGDLTLLQFVQLYMCHARGAKIIFHKGDTTTCFERALQHASDMHMVYIELKYTLHFSLLGAATLATEMLEQSDDRETIVIPLRLYEVGWSYVSAISMFAKIKRPDIRVVVVQMTEDLYGLDREGKEFNRQSLFPDRIEIGWLALIHDQSDLTNVFDAFDFRNQGKFSGDDLTNMLSKIGGDVKRNRLDTSKASYSQTEFVHEVISQNLTNLMSNERSFQPFLSQFSLDNLQQHKIIDQLVPVTEDQAAIAFIKCLEYTHTLTNGKGSIALGGLLSGNIQLKPNEKIVVLISGGFVDVIDFQTILNYGLDLAGQSFEVELDLQDNTNALSKVLNVIGSNNVSVHEVNMDRSCEALKQYHVRTTIQCHSRNFEQQRLVFEMLEHQGLNFKKPTAAPHVELNILSPPTPVVHVVEPSKPIIPSSPVVKPQRSIKDITVQSIREAQQRIKGIAAPTPIYHSTTYSKLCGCKVTLMLENIQKTGSFKIRGSSNMVLKAIEQSSVRPKGLVAASAGNHAQGVALISAKVGLPCTIVCPEYAPDSKLSNTRQYGAEVIKKGKSLEEAVKTAETLCAQRNWKLVPPYNDVDVIEGQGTMGCDIYDSVPDVDTVLVNVGGGGMIAGIALFLKRINPNIRIIGVQSANVSPLADFKQTNQLRYIEPAALSLADGTNVKMPGGVHTQVLHDLVDEYVTVSENEIASTIVHLIYNSRTVSEGAGCLGLAALMHHKISVRKDERVVVIICGGNIDLSTLRQVYEYGLRSLGRSFTIHLTTWDYPGNLHKIIALAARAELKVREIRHIRGTGDINWNEVTISLSFYSNSFHHQNFFLQLLVDEGLFPKVIGRKYIKDNDVVYQVFDKSAIAKEKQLGETFAERQNSFLEQYTQQANTSTVM